MSCGEGWVAGFVCFGSLGFGFLIYFCGWVRLIKFNFSLWVSLGLLSRRVDLFD
jgi:hypothetical protein